MKKIFHITLLITLLLSLSPSPVEAQSGTPPCDKSAACYDVKFSNPNIVGDFFIDGVAAAQGVNSVRLTDTPFKLHTIEAKNIKDNDPLYGDLYTYNDLKTSSFGFGGSINNIPLTATKTYLKGVLDVLCDPLNRKKTDKVSCKVTIDGIDVPNIEAGASNGFAVSAGGHKVHTELEGKDATNWSPITREEVVTTTVNARALQTTRLAASFKLKGILKISVLGQYPDKITGDIYVNGNLTASQAPTATVYVESGQQIIEVKNIIDLNSKGQYTYTNSIQTSVVASAITTLATVSPKKTWLVGFLNVTCLLRSKTANDDARCVVTMDDQELGKVESGKSVKFPVAIGSHTISTTVEGDTKDKWNNAPQSKTVKISGGVTAAPAFTFNLKSTAPSKPASTPSASTSTTITDSFSATNHLGQPRVVIADYMMWYDTASFDGTKTWDVPQAGAYNSDDAATIQRHVSEAQKACLDGFAAHWYGPTDSRTTNNFNQLLNASNGTNLKHAIVIQTNILPGATEQTIIDAIKHVMNNWTSNANYLKMGNKPVIIFTDMPRPWGNDTAAKEGWKRVREAADPNRTTIWMAEGLATTYNPLFDGLYVYRIDHKDFPQSWLKQTRWASALRSAEKSSGIPLYFADTIAAGFDDTKSVNAPGDLRSDAPHFARDRQSGQYYKDTFSVVNKTGGDFLFVKSFNEWIEGTEIEAGKTYSDLYLNLTCELANKYKGK